MSIFLSLLAIGLAVVVAVVGKLRSRCDGDPALLDHADAATLHLWETRRMPHGHRTMHGLARPPLMAGLVAAGACLLISCGGPSGGPSKGDHGDGATATTRAEAASASPSDVMQQLMDRLQAGGGGVSCDPPHPQEAMPGEPPSALADEYTSCRSTDVLYGLWVYRSASEQQSATAELQQSSFCRSLASNGVPHAQAFFVSGSQWLVLASPPTPGEAERRAAASEASTLLDGSVMTIDCG